MKIRPVVAELFHADRHTDRHDETIANEPEKAIYFETFAAVVDLLMVLFRVAESCSRELLLRNVGTLTHSRCRNPKRHQLIKRATLGYMV